MLAQKLQTIRDWMTRQGKREASLYEFLLARPFEEPPKTWVNRCVRSLFKERQAGATKRAQEAMFRATGVRPELRGDPLRLNSKLEDLKRVYFVLIDDEGSKL